MWQKYVHEKFSLCKLHVCRLNLSATSEETPKKGRGTKRKRVTYDLGEEKSAGYDFASEAHSEGAIEIHDTDHEGKFIKLFNTGEEVGVTKLFVFVVEILMKVNP